MPVKSTKEGKELNKLSQSPKAKAKAKETRAMTRITKAVAKEMTTPKLVKGEIQNTVREEIFSNTAKKEGDYLPFFQRMIQRSKEEALKNPNSKSGELWLERIIDKDILNQLDAQAEKYISRDRDFIEYRILKTLFDKQRDVFLDYIRYKSIAIMCSRRAGKTELNPRILVKACATPDTPCLYINITITNSIEQCLQNCLDVAKACELPVESYSFNKGYIHFANGSTIDFGGNKDNGEADKNRGYKYKLIIVDEAGHQRNMPYLMDEVLRPTLIDFADSVLILTGTPPRRKNTYFEKAFNSKEWKSYHWTMFDNPFIPDPENEIKRLCQEKGCTVESSFIQREYYGLIQYDTEAQLFKDFKTYKGPIPADFKPTNLYIGVDYGFSDYNGIVALVGNVQQRRSYVLCEHKFNKATVTEIVNKTRSAYIDAMEFYKVRNGHENNDIIGIYADTNEKSITYELSQTYGLPAYNAYKYDRDMALEQLAEECRTGRLLIPEDGELQNEYEQILHPRDENDNILPGLDEFYHPDITMALLYASRQWFYDCGLDMGGESTNKKTGEF